MIMTNFLQERKSVRKFKNKELGADEIAKIRGIIDAVKSEMETSEIDFAFFENGKIISNELQGKAGYGGVMIEAPHYVTMRSSRNNEETIIKGGYNLEKLNEMLIRLGLGTCWITIDHVDENIKKSIFGEDGDKVRYLIALGYAEGKKLFTPEATSDRLKIEDIAFVNNLNEAAAIEELENLGLLQLFSSVRYAPSYKNAQPWRFVIKMPYVYLYMVRSADDEYSLADMGIVMYYFEGMSKTLGVESKWEVVNEEDVDGCKVVAKFHI